MRSKPPFNGNFKLPNKQATTRVFLLAGFLGYVTAFVLWFQWLVFTGIGYTLAFLGIYENSLTRGIYILYEPYYYAIALLLPTAFGLSSFGWFGIHRVRKSRTAVAAGILSAVMSILFVYSAIQVLAFIDITQYFLRPILLFVGIIIWGAAILKIRTLFKHPDLAYWSGLAFAVSGLFSVSILMPVFLYFGLEYWFAILGWLYAFSTLVTAYSFFKLAKSQNAERLSSVKD